MPSLRCGRGEVVDLVAQQLQMFHGFVFTAIPLCIPKRFVHRFTAHYLTSHVVAAAGAAFNAYADPDFQEAAYKFVTYVGKNLLSGVCGNGCMCRSIPPCPPLMACE